MAVNMKELIADGFLHVLEGKPLSAITIKDILQESGVSRQTFYNHFLDKEDLICYIYDSRIIPEFDLDHLEVNFRDSLVQDFRNMAKHHSFLKQALMIESQNSLKNHMIEHAESFDLGWHQQAYGNRPMPDALKFATIYHAHASISMTFSWILGGMPVSAEEIADLITRMRALGMKEYFSSADCVRNPYCSDDFGQNTNFKEEPGR